MKPHAILLALCVPLSACTDFQDRPIVENGPVLAPGSLAGLGQPVALHDLVLTPIKIIEDSRCPINARCVWAGRIIVETRVDGAGWRETLPLTLGEPAGLRGYTISLVTAEPGLMAGENATPPDYRFAYEGWTPDNPPD